jgi:hypothetical protein
LLLRTGDPTALAEPADSPAIWPDHAALPDRVPPDHRSCIPALVIIGDL